MLFFKKRKNNVNKELESVQDDVRMKRALGVNYVCLPITSHNTDIIKDWCAREGYKCEVDHMNEEGTIYYRISGWD